MWERIKNTTWQEWTGLLISIIVVRLVGIVGLLIFIGILYGCQWVWNNIRD